MMTSSVSVIIFLLCGTFFGEAWGYSIPQGPADSVRRGAAINTTRAGFLYGPAVAGGPSYPSGPLGKAKVAGDIRDQQLETVPNNVLVAEDVARASNSTEQVCFVAWLFLFRLVLMASQ